MKPVDIKQDLAGNSYPGRGIVIGQSADGKNAVIAYFIMGRSVNSRNRVFVEEPDGIRTEAGDQTDTIRDFLEKGLPFEQALRTREFEPDGPNWTPRISGLLSPDGSYKLSILKAADEAGTGCLRQTFEYPGQPGLGHFIHTYKQDGDPIPSYEGEPTPVSIEGDIDAFTASLWENLNEDNKVSLFTRFINLETGKAETRIVNKNQ